MLRVIPLKEASMAISNVTPVDQQNQVVERRKQGIEQYRKEANRQDAIATEKRRIETVKAERAQNVRKQKEVSAERTKEKFDQDQARTQAKREDTVSNMKKSGIHIDTLA